MKFFSINGAIRLDEELSLTLDQLLGMQAVTTSSNNQHEMLEQGNLLPAEKVKQEADIGIIYHAGGDEYLSELIQQFKLLSAEYDAKFVFFTIDELELSGHYVDGILVHEHQQTRCLTLIPPLIYNLVLHSKTTSVSTMKGLRMMNAITVVNPVNRFYHNILFEMTERILHSSAFLLPWALLSDTSLASFTKDYSEVFLLPQRPMHSSRAISITKLSESTYQINNGEIQLNITQNELYYQISKMVRDRKYLIMHKASTMNWGSSPLEIRAYLHKVKSAQWLVLDIIGKREIFSKGSIYDKHSENLATIWNSEGLGDSMEVIDKVTHTAHEISELLDYYMPNLGCCYIDFMISTEGDPYLIGVGGFEQNDYLYQLDNKSSWITYIHNIFLYLLFLKKKMEKGVTHELD